MRMASCSIACGRRVRHPACLTGGAHWHLACTEPRAEIPTVPPACIHTDKDHGMPPVASALTGFRVSS